MTRFARTTLLVGALAAVALGASGCAPAASADGAGTDSGAAAEPQKLLVATGGSPRPFTFLDENDELTGYDIEILKLVDEQVEDLEFEFQIAEFPALFAGLDSGRFNIVANNLSATEERREKYDFSDPYIEAQFGVAYAAGSSIAGATTLDELAGKRTFGEPGLNFTKILEAYNEAHPDKKIEIEYTELDLQSQYKKVATGGADFVFSDKVVYDGYATGVDVDFSQLDGERLVEEYGTNLFSAYAISKQTPNVDHVVEELNGALRTLAADGTLTKLSEEFFDGLDVSPKTALAAGE
ncbi:transporter substrate-binding domain-containing protein [Leucobacter chromiireducens]|uniref:transporter substrate-binding domain-containing protein n=1 Tax=Leucobacter chromiireducens TaxID=283877 RepID=UPI0013DE2B41|nr:transporter substrate-binding domain-containing protein [Leucobacter chromiireducens]